jgi:hypothetical protein
MSTNTDEPWEEWIKRVQFAYVVAGEPPREGVAVVTVEALRAHLKELCLLAK